MTRNVLDEAHQDVGNYAASHDPHNLEQKLGAHGSRLYAAEVASLLVQQNLINQLKQSVSKDADQAHHTVDDDKKTQQKGRAKSTTALDHEQHQHLTDDAKSALSHGEKDRGEVEAGAKDGAAAAKKKDIRVELMQHIDRPNSLYGEAYLYELKKAGRLDALDSVQSESTFNTRLFVGQALAMAERDGLISGGEVVARGQKPHFLGGLGGGEASDDLTTQAQAGAGDPTRNAQKRLQKAEEKIRTLEEQLHIALQEITPVIADENRIDDANSADHQKVHQFIVTYRSSPEYKAAEWELGQARSALGLEIQNNESNLAAHAGDKNNPQAAQQAHNTILDSYSSLAASDQPEIAKRWVVQHQGDPAYAGKADQARLKSISDLADNTRANIAVSNLKEIFEGEKPEGTKLDQALEYIEHNVIGPYETFDKAKELTKIADLLRKQKAVWAIKHAKDDKAALDLAKLFLAHSEGEATVARKISTALGTLCVGFGSGNAVRQGAEALAKHGGDIREFYSKGKELRELLQKNPHAEAAADLAKEVRGKYLTFSRGIGVLALIGDAYALKGDWELAQQTPAGYGVLAGDLISTVGDAMVMIPGLEPLGEAISIVGMAISMIAKLFVGDPVGDARREATRQTLIDGHLLDPDQAKTVTNDDAAGNIKYAATLTGNAALDHQQLQALASSHGFLFKDSKMIETVYAVWKFYGNKKNQSGWHLLKYIDSLFEFIKAGNADAMKLPLIYCRPSVHGGQFDFEGDYPMIGAVDLRQAYAKGTFGTG